MSVNPTPPIPSDDDDNDDVVSGSGCLPGGVGSALESDDCIVEVEDACFVEFVGEHNLTHCLKNEPHFSVY